MGNFTLQPAPVRVPMFDAAGQMARAWLTYFQQLFALGSQVTTTTQTVVEHAGTLAYDDANGVDVAAIAEEWTRREPAPAARDYGAEIESAARLGTPEAARDVSGEIESAARLLAGADPAPAITRADIDELRALWAATDAPALANGATGTFTSADTKTVTVTRGLITGIA